METISKGKTIMETTTAGNKKHHSTMDIMDMGMTSSDFGAKIVHFLDLGHI